MKRVAAAWLCSLCAVTVSAGAAQLSVSVRTPQGAALRDAVVWVEGTAGKPASAATEISQHDQEFEPFVTVVSTGSRVLFPNRDTVKHHVYSFSAAKSFEIQLYSGLPTEPVTFDKAGVVVIGCNIHDWMLAYIAVVDSPWFAKSSSDGRAVLANLPAGRHVLHVWHPHQTAQSPPQPIEFTNARARREFKLVLDIAPPPRKPRPAAADNY